MILRKTRLVQLPGNCLDCDNNDWCSLPGKTKVCKPYWTKRHKDCPLIEVPGELIEQLEAEKKDLTGGNRKRSR